MEAIQQALSLILELSMWTLFIFVISFVFGFFKSEDEQGKYTDNKDGTIGVRYSFWDNPYVKMLRYFKL